MRSIGCLFVSAFVLSGCLLDRSALGTSLPASDGGVPLQIECGPTLVAHDEPMPWPRSHPTGTLLADHAGDLWMVVSYGVRYQVTGDDTLGEAGIDAHDAISMSSEEERCLTPSDEYWGPQTLDWQPVYGPDEEDRGPFVLDWGRHLRHRTTTEALDSYGYYSSWLDYFDSTPEAWSEFTDADPVTLRDGTLVHTQYGFAYVVNGRSFYFNPSDLVAEAGYHPENALWMNDTRLREIAPPSTSLTRETFELCPADEH